MRYIIKITISLGNYNYRQLKEKFIVFLILNRKDKNKYNYINALLCFDNIYNI